MKQSKIQTLRQKSKTARNNIAMAVAGTITALVFTVWVVADPAGIGETIGTVETTESRMFGGLFDQFKEQVASVRSAISNSEPVATTSSAIVMPSTIEPAPVSTESSQLAATTTATTTASPRQVQLYVAPSATTSTSSAQ